MTAPSPCDVLVRAAAVITMDPAAPLLRVIEREPEAALRALDDA